MCVREREREKERERERKKESELVNWCFEPSHALWTISGLKETSIKRYIVERTKKAEIRPEEQSRKNASCRENIWKEIQSKVPYKEK